MKASAASSLCVRVMRHSSLGKAGCCMSDESILVINTGSSSLKFGLYAPKNGDEQVLLDGLADGIGQSGGRVVRPG